MPRAAPQAPFDHVEALDAELTRLARSAGALRYALGCGFEALEQRSGPHELGFSSLEAYALERAERSSRWVQESRAVARRLRELPKLRQALICGQLSWSMVALVSRVATAEDEDRWLAEAKEHTVREMRAAVRTMLREREQMSAHRDASSVATPAELQTLTVTVDRTDAWLFECVRMLVEASGGHTWNDVVEALVAEGFSSLSPHVPKDAMSPGPENDGVLRAQRAWREQLLRFRDQAEALCEPRIRQRSSRGEALSVDMSFEGTLLELDRKIRAIARELATRDLRIGQLAERFWCADGWRRLGYATEKQYAEERVGVSLSSLNQKRRLARRATAMPRLAQAIERCELGYEAARVVAQVATPDTVQQWVERAAERTVKHLREEADAAAMLMRLSNDGATRPPSEALVKALEAAQSSVMSGKVFAENNNAARDTDYDAAVKQISAALLSPGPSVPQMSALGARVTLRLRVEPEIYRTYRWLEDVYARFRPTNGSFFRYLCCALIDTWKHTLGTRVAYADIYARDCYRCQSPVCRRKDVTPHHLEHRSAGGDDSPENLASMCVFCHLEGVHRGRLRARPPASAIRWEIGRTPILVVEGRRRMLVAA